MAEASLEERVTVDRVGKITVDRESDPAKINRNRGIPCQLFVSDDMLDLVSEGSRVLLGSDGDEETRRGVLSGNTRLW